MGKTDVETLVEMGYSVQPPLTPVPWLTAFDELTFHR